MKKAMIYKSNFDGQWHKVNPYYNHFDDELTCARRKLFASGIFRVGKDEGSYHLFVNGWSIGAWSPGDAQRARMFISAAFGTYYALARGK